MTNRETRHQRGFTLIELLVVVLIIGVIAAIAIPNLMLALQVASQKRSFADLKTISIAVAIYQHDTGAYPVFDNGTAADIVPVVDDLPLVDGWGEAFRYSCSDGTTYTLVSFGSDRMADLPYVHGPISRVWDDIVVVDTWWLQWPEGVQTN